MTTPGFLGGDTERMRTLGTELTTGAHTILAVKARATKAVQALEWLGSDQAAFLEAWLSTYGPMIQKISTALTAAAHSVKTQADSQDKVSASSGSSSTGAGSGPSGTLTGVSAASSDTGTATTGSRSQLGDLSAQHESGGSSRTISTGKGDPVGGISYGKYQIATGTGTAKEFVGWLGTHDPAYAERLQGLTPGGKDFATAWKAIATSDPEGFAKAQFDFIKQTHFDPAMAQTYAEVPGLSLEGRSPVLAETLFSTTVQHRMNTAAIVSRALAGKDVATMSDAQIISAIYDERGRSDGSVYFRSSPASTQHNIAERFEREKAQALKLLQSK